MRVWRLSEVDDARSHLLERQGRPPLERDAGAVELDQALDLRRRVSERVRDASGKARPDVVSAKDRLAPEVRVPLRLVFDHVSVARLPVQRQ